MTATVPGCRGRRPRACPAAAPRAAAPGPAVLSGLPGPAVISGYAAGRPGETAAAPRRSLRDIDPIRMGIIVVRARRHHRMCFALIRKIFTCHVRAAAGPFRGIVSSCCARLVGDQASGETPPYETNGFSDLGAAMICAIRRGQIREAGPAPLAGRRSVGFAVGRKRYLHSAVQRPPQGVYSCGGGPIAPGLVARPPGLRTAAGKPSGERVTVGWFHLVIKTATQSNIHKFMAT
jgi:hypothetical protein